MRKIKFIALALIAMVLAPHAALAADIPLLTWERGRQQQVVIAEGDLDRKWAVVLEENEKPVLTFVGSAKDSKGYVVFSVDIPADFPLGSYNIAATQGGAKKSIIAGVIVVEAVTRTAASSLVDLTAIIAIFILLTAIASTIRASKYRDIPFKSAQVLPRITDPIYETDENFWDRLERAPYNLRVNWLNSFKQSLLRFLLIREGELAHRLNKQFYGVAPLLGLIAGVIASIQVNKNGGVAATATTLFLTVAFIGIFDAFSGLAATLGFWAVQVLTGNVSSFRDILIALTVAITWVGPSIFSSLLRESIARDFTPKSSRQQDPLRLFGVIGAGIVGAIVFYFGQILMQSILYIEHLPLTVTYVHVAIIALALLIRGFADGIVVSKSDGLELRDESFVMARVVSPVTSLAVFAVVLIFTYNWTRIISNSLFVAVLFTIPYFFSFIRFGANEKIKVNRIPRNILIEALTLAAITFILFRQISLAPMILEKRVELLLLLAGIAPAAHALLSAIYASNEDKFSFERNPEII